ncbi:MAG: hypothetical protein NTZ33_10330 [Bacteroidetes bacterium]|nr:hypothetical protein [Bacteroidota bacterium]
MKTKNTVALEAENFYHIYNRGNNGESLFFHADNYKFFLVKLNDYLADFLIIHAFCLLNNHFHLLVEIKHEDVIKEEIKLKREHNKLKVYLENSVEVIVSKQFQFFFISYAKSINKMRERHGSLFEKPFKRKWVMNKEYYKNMMYYIHRNMIFHGYDVDYKDYPWSSYSKILEERKSNLPKSYILKHFTSKENFIDFHSNGNDLEPFMDAIID